LEIVRVRDGYSRGRVQARKLEPSTSHEDGSLSGKAGRSQVACGGSGRGRGASGCRHAMGSHAPLADAVSVPVGSWCGVCVTST